MDTRETFKKFNEDTRIWKLSQFTVDDVCSVARVTKKALEHFVDPARDLVSLGGGSVNPGRGRRRMFDGQDLLKISAAFTMSRLGFPQRFCRMLTDQVAQRAINLEIGLATKTNMTLVTYPLDDDDWAVIPHYEEDEQREDLPFGFQVLAVDAFVAHTKTQLEAIVRGEEAPQKSYHVPKPENPFAPSSNFMRSWTKDEAGNWLYVGLTLDETNELLELKGIEIVGDELIYDPAKFLEEHLTWEQRERITELDDKHEVARLARVVNGD